MNRATTLARYPQMQMIIDQAPGHAPDVVFARAHPSDLRQGVEAVGRTVAAGVQLVKALSLIVICVIVLYLIWHTILG